MRTYLSKRVRSSAEEGSIKSATKWSEGGGDVDKFLEWHNDPEMFRNYPGVFDAVYKILDDVLGENQSEDVGEDFQRLSKEDQERIMRLVESTGRSGDVSDTFLGLIL